MRAARITDTHQCPETAPKPHEGGLLLLIGSPMELVSSLMAARLTDLGFCLGAAQWNPVAQGSATVLFGGLPAAREGDQLTHGGVITKGDDQVQIGGPTVTIRINGDVKFALQVQQALAKLLPTPSGNAWLTRMAATGHSIAIQKGGRAGCDPTNEDATHPGPDGKNGPGSDSVVTWNPDNPTTDAGLSGKDGHPGSEIVLGHEMVHGLHHAEGNCPKEEGESYDGQPKPSYRQEERSTVGTSPDSVTDKKYANGKPIDADYSKDMPTENSWRRDLDKGNRKTYYPSGWANGNPPW